MKRRNVSTNRIVVAPVHGPAPKKRRERRAWENARWWWTVEGKRYDPPWELSESGFASTERRATQAAVSAYSIPPYIRPPARRELLVVTVWDHDRGSPQQSPLAPEALP